MLDPAIPPCFYRVSVKARVCNVAGEILLVKEGDYGWCLPGGGLEHGEDVMVGLGRELSEELDMADTINIHPEPIAVSFAAVERNGFHGKIPVCFVCYVADDVNGNVRPGAHTHAAAFHTPRWILQHSEELAYDERELILSLASQLV